MPHLGLADDLLQHMGEVFQNHDGGCPGVGELVLEFSGRVQGIAIHHHGPGTQGAKQCDRILQDIGHHQGHTVSLFDTDRLQVLGEQSALLV